MKRSLPADYYAWKKRPETKRCRDDRALAVEIKAFHRASRATYGSPRLLHDIRETGRLIGRNRIIRIMREHGLSGRRKRRYVHTTNSNHQFPIAEKVLQRDFKAEAPNQKWVNDITYIRTHEGWLYLALLVDLYSRKIVGWAVSDSMHTDLPLRALRMALLRLRPGHGLVHHTDRGVQYASKEYRPTLEEHGIMCSMSRRSDCWYNAHGESVFPRFKDDLVCRRNWESKAQAAREAESYIEYFDNSLRRHSAAGDLSPDAFARARQIRLQAT